MPRKEKPQVSHLNSHIGYHLRMVSNAVSQTFAKKLASYDVTVAEWVILREMYSSNDKTSPSHVAHTTGLTRGAVSKLVDRLLHKGLISRTEASADRRFQEIKLTANAIKLVPHLASVADENDKSFFSVLNEDEKKNFTETLRKLAESHGLNTSPID